MVNIMEVLILCRPNSFYNTTVYKEACIKSHNCGLCGFEGLICHIIARGEIKNTLQLLLMQ